MTLKEIKDFLNFKYTNEVAEALDLTPHNVYRWEKHGVPYKWQKHFSKISKGFLKVSAQ